MSSSPLGEREMPVEPNLIGFWRDIPGPCDRHPADRQVLDRRPSDFDLRGLPNPFFGPLATAPVVLLYLNPGLRDSDIEQAERRDTQAYFVRQRQGNAPLPSEKEYPTTYKWLALKLKQFECEPDNVREKLAVLNLCAYRSKKFE